MTEPTHIREIIPDVMQDIARRCNRHRKMNNLPTLQEEIRQKNAKATEEVSGAFGLKMEVFGLKIRVLRHEN